MVPAAVGVNPFATITALAERSVEMMAKKHGIKINYQKKNGKFMWHWESRSLTVSKVFWTCSAAQHIPYPEMTSRLLWKIRCWNRKA